MRYGWRVLMVGAMAALLGLGLPAARFAWAADTRPNTEGSTSSPVIHMTVELDWTNPVATTPISLEIEISQGKILGVVPASQASEITVSSTTDGVWRTSASLSGRVRARVEAPIHATLTVKAGAQVVPVPLARLLEGPQRTVPPAAIEVGVARIAWDTIEIDAGESRGVAAPGEKLPIRVGFNVLGNESSEVNLHYTAELRSVRSGAVVWTHSQKAVITTDAVQPSSWVLPLVAPIGEGLHTLEIKAGWEPIVENEGSSRIGRLLRRRRPSNAMSGSATRRVSFVVLDPKSKVTPEKVSANAKDERVDSIPLAAPHSFRASATGRAPMGPNGWRIPETAMVEETRRDRLRGWVASRVSDPVLLAPADTTGMAWAAIGLKVPHPERPHRLTMTVAGGHPSALGVGIVTSGGPAGKPKVVLDVCISGPPVIEGNRPQTYSWIVWPEAPEPVLVLVNRNPSAPVQPGTVTLTELAEVPPLVKNAAVNGGGNRSLGIDLTSTAALDRFGGGADPIIASQNLAKYLTRCGATSVVLADTMADRTRRTGLSGQATEDSIGPDRLDLMLTLLSRLGINVWLDLAPHDLFAGLPAAGTEEAASITRVGRDGRAEGAVYHPIDPRVRNAMAARVTEIVKRQRSQTCLSGLLVRLGPGSTLLGRPDTGVDDATFERFVTAMFDTNLARTIPGHGAEEPERFEARVRFLEGKGQKAWLTWRARELAAVYGELASAAATATPGMKFAVATPDLDAGSVGEEVRRLDRVGHGPAQAWRSVGLDLAHWPTGETAPIVLRGLGLSSEDLARDLAANPELDEQVAARHARGLWLAASSVRSSTIETPCLSALALPEGVTGGEPLGHALATLDGGWFFASNEAIAGHEEQFRQFANVIRALPLPEPGPATARLTSGVSARVNQSGAASYLAIANDTPYPIQVETVLKAAAGTNLIDLSRTAPLSSEPTEGGLRVVAHLQPFGVVSARLDGRAEIERTTTHPGAAVLDGMKAQYDDLAVTLARLNRLAAGHSGTGPINPDFESPAVQLTSSRANAMIEGWKALGDKSTISLDSDQPHSGRSSLRFEALSLPASVTSEPFTPVGHPSVTIHSWVRADKPETRVRLWIEGQIAGRPFIRQLEFAPTTEWSATAARVSGIPETGFESARLRFEMLTPGRIWLDDLTVSGPALTEAEKLNARRDLMAALSAYRDHRYADFARLAGSHWTRHVASEPAATGRLAGDRSGIIRTGVSEPTALPTNRTLR